MSKHTFEEFAGLGQILTAWGGALTPTEDLTLSKWSDAYRYMSTKVSAIAGPYRTSHTPYWRAVQDDLSPQSPIKQVVVMKSAQVGFTEIGNNWIGYTVDHYPGPMMMVLPTLDLAKRHSQQRLTPLFEDTPRLRDKMARAKSRDSGNTIYVKNFKGGVLVLTGANSGAGLRSTPARNVFADEVDAYPADVDEEGSVLGVLEARMFSFGNRGKMMLGSTPTIKGASAIEEKYEASDQRRYFVPCPHCGHMQWLKFEKLQWTKGKPKTAQYFCDGCGAGIEERHKTWMMAEENGAEWRPTATPEQIAVAEDSKIRGYHISGLYSPIGMLSWAEIARRWEVSQGNDAELQTVKNTILGETWQEKGEAPEWQRLYDRRDRSPLGRVPMKGLLLTAGADVQRADGGRVEIDIWAWGRDLQSWLVDHIVIDGEVGSDVVQAKLNAVLAQTWQHESGTRMALSKMAIDTGDGASTNEVYQWVRKAGKAQVLAVKGRPGFDRTSPVDGPHFVEVTIGGRKLRRGVQLWNIAVAVFKSETYRYLRMDKPTDEDLAAGTAWPPGFIHLPSDTTAEWVKQLTAEELITVRSKSGYNKVQWQQTRDRNEALDMRVYARAAAWLMGIDRWDDRRWSLLEQQFDHGKEAPKPSGVPNRQESVKRPAKRPGSLLGGRKKGWS